MESDYNQDREKSWKLYSATAMLLVFLGMLIYPWWWYKGIFEGKLFSLAYWWSRIEYLFESHLIKVFILIVIIVVLYLLLRIKTLKAQGKKYWNEICQMFSGPIGTGILWTIIGLITLSLFSLEYRSNPPQKLPSSIIHTKPARESPLAKLKLFICISKQLIDSIYSQHEPELIPKSVIEEIQSSLDVSAGVNIYDFFKTEAGKNELNKKLIEYYKVPKSTERKLKDLVGSLFDRGELQTLGRFQGKSTEINEVNQAVKLLQDKYNLNIDKDELLKLRDRLLSKEIEKFLKGLEELRGLVLVEGNWYVEAEGDFYYLKNYLIKDVTNPPVCRVTLKRKDILKEYREIFDKLQDKPIQLSVFGNVITAGMSSTFMIIKLHPIAVY